MEGRVIVMSRLKKSPLQGCSSPTFSGMNGMGNINQMSNMMARAGASQAGVRSLPGSIWNMASRMAGGNAKSVVERALFSCYDHLLIPLC